MAFMTSFNKLFPSRLARQSLVFLVLGFITINMAFVYVYATYSKINRKHPAPKQLIAEVNQIIRVAKIVGPEQLKIILPNIRHRSLRLAITSRGGPRIQKIPLYSRNTINKIVMQNPHHFRVKYALDKKRHLLIFTNIRESSWLRVQFIAMLVLLSFILLILFAWIVRRMSLPLHQFAEAASRFGRDVNAPPLPETGSDTVDKAAIAFNEMQARIRKLLQDRTQMLAAISHDLRTPITRLRLRMENINSDQTEKVTDDLNEMEHMITSILAFARDYNQEETVERFDIVALLESICDEMQDLKYNVSFKSSIQRHPFEGRLNALKRSFTNLIENAIKYGSEAKVVLEEKDQRLIIRITDNGSGIAESELEKVFLPFYRIDKSRTPSKPGSGLGLAVAKDIIISHGGTINLRNCPEGGLMVKVVLSR